MFAALLTAVIFLSPVEEKHEILKKQELIDAYGYSEEYLREIADRFQIELPEDITYEELEEFITEEINDMIEDGEINLDEGDMDPDEGMGDIPPEEMYAIFNSNDPHPRDEHLNIGDLFITDLNGPGFAVSEYTGDASSIIVGIHGSLEEAKAQVDAQQE